jgi:hypothetical protein
LSSPASSAKVLAVHAVEVTGHLHRAEAEAFAVGGQVGD